MKHPIQLFIIISFITCLIACGVEKKNFDKATWNNRDDILYVNRESMVKDLMENYLHKGMTYQELVELIGQPDKNANLGSGMIVYDIMVDYGWGIDPVEGKLLQIYLSPDSTVVDYSLEHWKK